MLLTSLSIVTKIIECVKFKRSTFADTILIDSSNETSASLQSDDPVTNDDGSPENESVSFSRALWCQGNLLNTLMNVIILDQNIKSQMF